MSQTSLLPAGKSGSLIEVCSNSSKRREFVKNAIKAQKIFLVHPWFPAVKDALLKRGWVEKVCNFPRRQQSYPEQVPSDEELPIGFKDISDYTDQAWTDRLLQDYPPNFMWLNNQNFDCRILDKAQIINMHPQHHFALKVDLVASMQTMQWHTKLSIANTLLPRGYRLDLEEEKSAFSSDFNLTACIGLLAWIVYQYEKSGSAGLTQDDGTVSTGCVDFARTNVEHYIFVKKHEDLDWLYTPSLTQMTWDSFLKCYKSLMSSESKFCIREDACAKLHEVASKTLESISAFWPQMSIDGHKNIWICKPGKGSRGEGIVLLDDKNAILKLPPRDCNKKENNWVVQKYMERPLLIYETKFDIRQWFLVTSFSPLTVWFYKESYLKFTSKPFSLDDLNESIHLCNYAVQKNFENAPARHSELPEDNMWDSSQFKEYLTRNGKGNEWEEQIYPGMKQLIMGVLFARQDLMEVRRNSFQLYGADIMINEDLVPWLIEINSFPSMELSSSACRRLCPQVMEDTIKVVIDRKSNFKAKTGMFELIHKAKGPPRVALKKPNPADVAVMGLQISWDIDWPWSNNPANRPLPRLSSTSLPPNSTNKPKRAVSLKKSTSRGPSAKSSRSNLALSTENHVTRQSKSAGVLTPVRGKRRSVPEALATSSKIIRNSRSSQQALKGNNAKNIGSKSSVRRLSAPTSRKISEVDAANNNIKGRSRSASRKNLNKST